MGNTLQDQLLKAGLIDKNKANKADKELRKQSRQQRNKKQTAQPTAQQLRQQEKAAKDRELNLRREEARKQREIAGQIKQLVDTHRHPRSNHEDDKPFYFDNKGKVKQMYVSAETHKLIISKKLIIVNCNGVFELVPNDIAEKIRQRNPSLVIDLTEEKPTSEDDPYSDYQVPDDLIW
ncbi:MAG: DUF2058 domain-containing protein [Candidatus Thiodiazotropha lotti]|uniref:DUF2058 domain-containing protein n=1 Tax=Candidatus Thiodiazotropha lotti TaxID=2792787 RepID=A0A9E4K447_9GAMM|nr:DUF2058 domain-containing protein [Candidatus Thiodiazotropha lotti]MCW4202805.1 DUF2058 domain-containing protein [Candidatus Thiodiazotropha lotti]ODC00749.1 hypothetical protein A3197_10645 [Candidatus Thiodiazotropha endoloripes]